MITKATYIQSGDELTNPGEVSSYSRHKRQKDNIARNSDFITSYGIIYCCPQCGEVSAGTQKHKFYKNTMSCEPSLVHSCGWHKTLTNGIFK